MDISRTRKQAFFNGTTAENCLGSIFEEFQLAIGTTTVCSSHVITVYLRCLSALDLLYFQLLSSLLRGGKYHSSEDLLVRPSCFYLSPDHHYLLEIIPAGGEEASAVLVCSGTWWKAATNPPHDAVS